MAYAFVQQADGVTTASGTTTTTGTGGTDFPSNLTAGNLKWFVALYVNAGGIVVLTFSDPNNNNAAHIQLGAIWNSGANNIGMVWGYVKNINGGSGTTTATAASAVSFFSIYCGEYSGLDPVNPSQTSTSNVQVSPGTGTDAVTSGLMTPTVQPAAVIGFSDNITGTVTALANAGTGFTGRTGVVNYGSGGGFSSRPEDMRITSLANIAATFTAVVGTNNYVTAAAIFSEASPVSSLVAPMPFYNTIHIQE